MQLPAIARNLHDGQPALLAFQNMVLRISLHLLGHPDAEPFDLLCHLALNAPVLTRRHRADRVKRQQAAFFHYYHPATHDPPAAQSIRLR